MANRDTGSGVQNVKDGSLDSNPLSELKRRRRFSGITWGDATPSVLVQTIEAVSQSGALISFSKTMDGGAVAIYIKDGTASERFYAGDADELAELLEHIHSSYAA